MTGTIAGASLKIADGYFRADAPSTTSTGLQEQQIVLYLTSFANACELYQQGFDSSAGSSLLKINVRTQGTESTPVMPGAFTVFSSSQATGNYAEVEVKSFDATCNDTKNEATGGTVTVTSLSASSVVGTFDVTSASGNATGSFDLANCVVADAGAGATCSM